MVETSLYHIKTMYHHDWLFINQYTTDAIWVGGERSYKTIQRSIKSGLHTVSMDCWTYSMLGNDPSMILLCLYQGRDFLNRNPQDTLFDHLITSSINHSYVTLYTLIWWRCEDDTYHEL